MADNCDLTTRSSLHDILDYGEDVVLLSNNRVDVVQHGDYKGDGEQNAPLIAKDPNRRASLPFPKKKSVVGRPPTPFTRDKKKGNHKPKSFSVDFINPVNGPTHVPDVRTNNLASEPGPPADVSEVLPILGSVEVEHSFSRAREDDDAQSDSEITLIDFSEPPSESEEERNRDALDDILGLLDISTEGTSSLAQSFDDFSDESVTPVAESQDSAITIEVEEEEFTSSHTDFDIAIFVDWRNVGLRSIEELYEHMLPPPSRTSYWPEILKMKVYPLSFHFALLVLEHTMSAAVEPLLRKTINGVDQSLLLDFIAEFSQMPTIHAVANHDKARALIVDVLGHIELISATVRQPGDKFSNYGKVIREAMVHDVIELKRSVSILLDSGEAFINASSKLAYDELHSLMELLQTLIDQREKSPTYRLLERALRKLVNKTGILPKYLFKHEVRRIGRNPIAGGGFADVWRGELHGKVVALKVLRHFEQTEESRTRRHQSFCKEAMMWRQFDHPNVLPFYGVCMNEFSPQLAMVAPWLHFGNILKYLKLHPDVDRIDMIIGIARGLCYLHSLHPQVIHGDLRASNVLVDDEGQPRVADFGLSQMVDSQGMSGVSSMGGKGSVRWQAPELLNVGQSLEDVSCTSPTTRSDTYAFAMVCLEIYTEESPFPKLRDGQVILEVAVRKKRPERPQSEEQSILPYRRLSDGLWLLMQECWEQYPSDRPTMEAALQWLESLQNNYSNGSSSYNSYRHENRTPPYCLARVDVLRLPERIVVLPPVDFLRQQRRSMVGTTIAEHFHTGAGT